MKYIWQLFLLLFLLTPTSAQANEVYDAHITTELISETTSIQPGKPFWVAYRLKLDKGWHTYWKNPGDAGLPSQVSWGLPRGFKAGQLRWPTPIRIEEPPIVIYGYEGELYLLTEFSTPANIKPGQMVVIESEISYLACEHICVPGKAQHSLRLFVKSEASGASETKTTLFEKIRFSMPLTETLLPLRAEMGSKAFFIEVGDGGARLDSLEMTFFSDTPNRVNMESAQEVVSTEAGYRLKIPKSTNLMETPTHLTGVLKANRPIWGSLDKTAVEIDIALSGSTGSWQSPDSNTVIPANPHKLWPLLGGVGLGLFLIIFFFLLRKRSSRP